MKNGDTGKMKKSIAVILLISAVLLSACSSKEPQKVQKDEKKLAVTETKEVIDEYYLKMQSDERPIAVMIDNDVAASRPQMGLESAYMVYEIIVEGGASRFMALFKEHTLDKVGPVRSSRHYFLDYALEHDAVYCHAGWSPQASRDISNLGVNNINGIMGVDGRAFWRDNTYDRSWHNLYSGVDKLYEMAASTKGYRTVTEVKHLGYHKQDTDLKSENIAQSIDIAYSQFYRVSYEYDSEKKVYKRYVDGAYHMSQTGECLTAKNIILYKVRNYTLNDGENKGRQNIENIGSGTGYYITNGKVVNINWSKPSRNAKTLYTLEDGTELILNPGNTFVQIVPSNMNIGITGNIQ